MVVLTFIFAVLNICLGFALATYLGNRPAGADEAVNTLDTNRLPATQEPDTALASASPSPTVEAMTKQEERKTKK